MSSYEIDGRTVTLPCDVRDAWTAVANFTASADALRGLLPTGVQPLLWRSGRGLVSIGAIRYLDNDLGAYDELSVAAYVREATDGRTVPVAGAVAAIAAGNAGTYIHRLPVSERFTCLAGREIWGFPKEVDDLRFTRGPRHVEARWFADDEHVLTLRARAGGRLRLPVQELQTFSRIAGSTHVTPFSLGGRGARFGVADARLTLGSHPYSDELRALRLSARPMSTLWVGHLEGSFGTPTPMDRGGHDRRDRPRAAAGA